VGTQNDLTSTSFRTTLSYLRPPRTTSCQGIRSRS
jgi:hypothetical protein